VAEIPVNGTLIDYPDVGDVDWGTAATNFAILTSAALGKIGLASGITVDVASTLDVTGATTLDSTLTVAGTTTLNGTANLNGNTNLGNANGDTIAVTGILNVDSGTLYVNPTDNKVGINDSTPSEALDVTGNVAVSGSITGASATLTDLTVDTNVIKTDSANNRVGINTSTPTVALDVVGSANISGQFNLVPAGTILQSILNSTPTGFLLCDGSTWNRTTYSTLFAVMPSRTATVTMTIASPCVVTWASHGLATGQSIQFSTTGALPTGITAGTPYFIRVINANTFNLYDTLANSMAGVYSGSTTGQVNTSGSQSGTHTGLSYLYGNGDGSTTFNIPDLRGAVPRGAGTSSGYISSSTLILGEKSDDQFQKFVLQVSRYNPGGGGALAVASHVVSASVYPTSPRELSGYFADEFINDGTNGLPRTGMETRPKSQAFNFYIKF
jgi:microcystin-dependent protein